jgi:hypothetical protein
LNTKAITKAIEGHMKRNLALRAKFEQLGLNFNEPRPIEFQFWARSQYDAGGLAQGLYKMGFFVKLLAPSPAKDDPERWSVETGAKIPLTQALSQEFAEKLVRLAAQEDSVFDGWGTSV